jgi:hypothetical protein
MGKQQSKKETTATRYKKAIQEFLDSLGNRADNGLNALTPGDIEHFRGVAPSKGLSIKRETRPQSGLRPRLVKVQERRSDKEWYEGN